MKRCPLCKLANPDAAVRCDCGFDFSGAKEETRDVVRASMSNHYARIGRGVCAVVLALVAIMTIQFTRGSFSAVEVGAASIVIHAVVFCFLVWGIVQTGRGLAGAIALRQAARAYEREPIPRAKTSKRD